MRKLAAAILGLALASPAWAQKDTLTVDLVSDVATMDPQVQWDTESASVYRNIFDNLVTRDIPGKIVPQVATAWHYTDPLTLVFDLRSDIVFQDGSKLTAEDVAFSVRRMINPAFKSPQLSQFDQIVSADVTGPAQVTLHTKTPYPVLLTKLSIVPKAYVEKVGDAAFNQQVMGSGPYRLRSWQRGQQSVLDAVDTYWGGKPPFRTAIFRAVPDAGTRMADLRSSRALLDQGAAHIDVGDRWDVGASRDQSVIALGCGGYEDQGGIGQRHRGSPVRGSRGSGAATGESPGKLEGRVKRRAWNPERAIDHSL